jgi:WD40 repeat protein
LQIVANTIVAFFAGDVAAFWQQAAGVFDTIRQVLDEQWARLVPLEQEVLVWLAIERVPVRLAALRANLVEPPTPRVLLETVAGLQRRSLLEQRGPNLALQNVVTEYLTERLIAELALELQSGRLDWLHHYALLKTDAAEYVRQSQLRLFVEPIAQQLVGAHGVERVGALVRRLLDALRDAGQRQPSYAAGNLLNLLVSLQIDLAGYDFSGLSVWQADLREVTAFDVNFATSHFAHPAFSDVFDAVNSVAWSPDGSLVAAGSGNGVLGAWRVADGQRHTLFVGHTSSVSSVVWSRDGRLLASASSDATVRLWDTASGQLVQTLPDHNASQAVLAFVPGTSLLLLDGADGMLRQWNTRDGVSQGVFDQHENGIQAFAVDPAGALVAVADGVSRVHLWRIATGERVVTLPHPQLAMCVAFSPDGGQLVTGCFDTIARVWDVGTGQVLRQLQGHHERVSSASWSPDGSMIATSGTDSTIRLWDAGSGELLRVLRGHLRSVNGLTWSPDGTLLASAGHDETVRLWKAHSGDALRVLRGNAAGVLSVTFGSDSATLYSTLGHVVRVWDVQQRRLRRILRGHRDVLHSVRASPDGAHIASSGRDGSVRVWDAARGRLLHVLAGHTSEVHAVAWSPDGRLLASASDDTSVRLWDVHRGQLVRCFTDHTQGVRAVSFSPDGTLLVSGSLDQTVRVWSVASGQTPRILSEGGSDALIRLAVRPDSTIMAHNSRLEGIVVWDVQHGTLLRQLTTSGQLVTCLAWAPDGKWLASGIADRGIRLWDTRSWETQVLGYHSSWVSEIAWSADGSLLASCSTLGEILLWDGRSGARIGELRDAGPYAGMNIAGASGFTDAQHQALLALGAVDGKEARGRSTDA